MASRGTGCLLSCRRLLLLLWKNIIFRRRHYVVTAFEIVLPTLTAIMLVLLRSQIFNESDYQNQDTIIDGVTYFRSYEENELDPYSSNILFSPNNSLTERIIDGYMERVCEQIECYGELTKFGFDTEQDLERVYLESQRDMYFAVGIVFMEGFENEDFVSNKLSYKIRRGKYNSPPTNELIPWLQVPGPDWNNENSYRRGGYLGTQLNMDKTIMKFLTKNEPPQNISIQGFPYPPYHQITDFNLFYFLLMPQFLVLGFVFVVPSVVRNIVSEKETGIKELMRMMGLQNAMHLIGWMLNSMLILTFTVTIVVVIFFVEFNSDHGPLIQYGDPTLWWVVLMLFAFAVTSFCFFIASFFERPSIGIIVGLVLYVVSYNALAETLNVRYADLSLAEKLGASLIPHVSLHLALKVMGGFEGNAVGSKWSNFFDPTSTADSLTVAHCCLMFLVDTVLYFLLALYIESVLPSKYGVRRPWYYIFLPSTYLCCGNKPGTHPGENTKASIRREDRSGFESEPVGLRAGIVIKNLRKVYGSGKIAVDNISCKMYDGQITALLGHNGAGKTTTMSILTGMFAPTSGTATINGYDINEEMELIRSNLGLCAQHNLLFDKLSVREHLVFFGRLKGMSASGALADANELIGKLQLTEKRNTLSMDLSGGQKRKLSLGMALIGGTKVVVLDEPTSGMDPESRRAIWDLLLQMRGERTILLTTHYMEEADVLGDRIAIMSSGKLQCCGTPMFLKQHYGAGYTLKMTISPTSPMSQILHVVQKYIPRAFFKNDHAPNSNEIALSLPSGDETTSAFPSMFSELTDLKDSLKILTIGLSLTTMDDVFVKVGELSEQSHTKLGMDANSNLRDSDNTNTGPMRKDRIRGLPLFLQQFWGLLIKRVFATVRRPILLLFQLIWPIVLTIATIVIASATLTGSDTDPPLAIKLSDYKNPRTMYTSGLNADALGGYYKDVVGDSALKSDGEILQSLVSEGIKDLGGYRANYIVAAELNETTAKALFSTIPNHAAPLALNLVSNAMLRSMSPGTQHTIELTIHPLKDIYNLDDALTNSDSTTLPILFGVLIPLGMAAVAATFIIAPVEERLCKAKQLQLMTGVSPVFYWLSSYIWDFCLVLVIVGIMLACFPIFESHEAFTAHGGLAALVLIFSFYGLAAIAFSYLFSHFVITVAGGFTVVILIHLATGMILSLATFFMERGDSNTLVYRIIGTWFPTFTFSTSLMKYTAISSFNSRCNIIKPSTLELVCKPGFFDPEYFHMPGMECCENCADLGIPCFEPKSYFSWSFKYRDDNKYTVPGLWQELVYLLAAAVLYFLLTQIVEYGLLRTIFSCAVRSDESAFQEMSTDNDVQQESHRVRALITEGRAHQDAFIASDLCKSFGSMAAVSKLSFGVHHGECFGLLGVNGAGKSTTFRMLTGDEICSSGNAFTLDHTLRNNRAQFLASIGYCPQFDGIIGVLSGRQMLELFARLRGIPRHSVGAEADRWLHKMGLYESGNVQCQNYSGGMKRRLSAAMALVGDLPLIMMDEPTSGVDPVARRQFWSVIESVRQSGQAVILTSHSMEECEALCSRLGIMVNGQFQCMGGVQHLKNKFAQGYSVSLKLRPMIPDDSPEINSLNTEICTRLHPCVMKDRHQNVLKYQVYNTSVSWGVLFKTMEDLKVTYQSIVEDYNVDETSLEDVFLAFARQQYPDRTAQVSMCKKIITCQF